MDSCPGAIERTVVDTSGRVGSLYDASRDLLLKNSSVKSFDNPQFTPHSKCYTLPGGESNGVINLLKAIEFDDALLQSILLGIVEPLGISSFINYNRPINENTRFLYYSYKHREEMLNVIAGQADKIIPFTPHMNNATHLITRIIWGFEILCVIQNLNDQSADSIERLLYNISGQLQNCDKSLELTEREKRQLEELSNVTILGSEECVDNSNIPLLTVLDRIRGWQHHTSFHVPIHYTLYPLKELYKNQQSLKLYHFSDQDNLSIAKIEPIMMHLNGYFNDLKQMFKNLPKNLTNSKVDKWLKDIPGQLNLLSDLYEEFKSKLQNILVDVRLGTRQSIEINNIICAERYSSLRKPATDVFYDEAQQWLAKIKLIKRFNDDKITYTNVFDIHNQSIYLTFEEIDEVLKDYCSKQHGSAILWYSSDRLKREKTDEWEQIYQQLTSERQSATSKSFLIYVDFTRYHQ